MIDAALDQGSVMVGHYLPSDDNLILLDLMKESTQILRNNISPQPRCNHLNKRSKCRQELDITTGIMHAEVSLRGIRCCKDVFPDCPYETCYRPSIAM